MQYGFNAPTAGALSAPDSLIKLAQGGEAMGFDYATFSDHVVIPNAIHATYPYSETGEFPGGAGGPRHEQLTEVAFIAGATKTLRLVLSVMVVPHRPALLAAKVLSTIDVLSGGRLVVGIGAGWMAEEFTALQTEDFAARGVVTDEYLDAFRVLWTQTNPSFAGKYVQFSDISFEPKPVQTPLPIWVGGESGPALRRTARIGDAWYPIGTNPAFPLDSLARFKAAVARLRAMTEKAGRDPASVALAYRVSRLGQPAAKAGDGEHKLFTGDDAQVAADIASLRDAGVSFMDFGFAGGTSDAMLEAMKRFKDQVLPRT
ncbi:MAG: TIGR03619 family F420-dependent LLM class oxidoreductase [Acetobacteraceae bacterium]|nr:TIGR03619 family F420-dependent LLM class oxidoreductase [Acetobacteraceae bacterium]